MTKPVSDSRRLIHGTEAAGKPINGSPLLSAPSTVSNNPTHGARVRFRVVVSVIATQCSTERKRRSRCFLCLQRITLIDVTVRRERRWTSVGATPKPGTWFAPPGSDRIGGEGDRTVGAFGVEDHVGDSVSVQAVTRVNAEQAPKK